MSGIATATSSPTPSSATNPIAHLSLASVAQYLGLAAAIFYLLGLIIVSASLGRFATMNRRLFDVQYIPAGILFAVLVGMYLSFMKLFLFEAESVVWNVQKAGGPTGSPLLWGFTGFLFQLLGMVFCLIVLTLLISSLFMDEARSQVFHLISLPVALVVPLFLQGTLERHPRFRVFAFLAIDVIGITIFVVQGKHVSEPTMSLFWGSSRGHGWRQSVLSLDSWRRTPPDLHSERYRLVPTIH